MKKKKIKIIIILGQTATGKSDLAARIAKKLGGEIISADSRQVYKGFDIGSGKITKKEMRGVFHYLLDVASPKRQFSAAKYKKLADNKIIKIYKTGKIPFIVGGSGFYIQTIVDGLVLPKVEPNNKLRKELEKKSAKKLFSMLKKLDKNRAKKIEKDNPRRLIRAIEIAKVLGKTPKLKTNSEYEALQIGLKLPDKKLKNNIHKRLMSRIRKGMISEVKKLHAKNISWKRLESFGLEYRFIARYLQGKIKKKEMLDELETEIWHFAKRQMRWFKRDARIKWFNPNQVKKIEIEITNFLNNYELRNAKI
ncbi:tRNA (adenosine(37)-N6)-dimethylallyltransferase MiaA [Candidatus Campbellbacteria bacterium RIFCSPLOWO2_02_35_12]|uniref:tRNA dimethylallyltransferase n=1 Tax=Candidatus Campbellbacteria bacterium RIFCSPLOWO2_02_35_12 TaxID=1797580 RepID=A0A1F5EGB7_9BACT|nr:MAG: tRNA (adenosine(37)-N6)-dimethylallyltransferase MiaA [Candidatus Campbellbacteria bacterium RIFCSPLOWO2_02_35_12]